MLPQEAQLAKQLWGDLDSWVGDALADRPEAKSGPAAVKLTAALLPCAAATLQRHISDAAVIRSLRRLLAALLRTETEDGDNMSESSLLQMLQLFANFPELC